MRFLLTIGLALVLSTVTLSRPAFAQDNNGSLITESSAGSSFGVGGRAVGMSEAVMVSTRDGFGIVYNPATLVKIKRPEFLGALSFERVDNKTTGALGFNSVAENNLDRTRLSSLTLTVPVPTYRGSFVLSFGVNRTHSFDNTFTENINIADAKTYALEEAGGGIREYGAAAAIELSPRLAVGTTLIYFSGGEDYNWNYIYSDLASTDQNIDNIKSDYHGVGARLGGLFEVNENFALAITVNTPVKYKISQDYVQTTITDGTRDISQGTYEYHLTHPFAFGGGASFRTRLLTVEVDTKYINWSELKYDIADDPNLVSDNFDLQRSYSGALSIMAGAEYVLPQFGLVLRGGFKHDPLPYSNAFAINQVEQNRNSFSFGLSYLIDRVAMLDVGYARATYKLQDNVERLSQKYSTDKVMVSVGYRI